MKAEPFKNWLARANRGDRFIYHRGFLMRDAHHETGGRHADTVALRRRAVQIAHHCGQVTMVQRRIAEMDYEYLAVRL